MLRHVTLAAVTGGTALGLGFWQAPAALGINLAWFGLLLLMALLVGPALRRPALATHLVEGALALAIVQGVMPLLREHVPVRPVTTQGNSISWSLTFASPEQAVAKILPRPADWNEPNASVYLRIDLGREYRGAAGFSIAVNGVSLGRLDNRSTQPDFVSHGPLRWAMTLPRAVLDSAPHVRVEVRPAGLDPLLSIAGMADPLIEPFGLDNSLFFDGSEWRNDRLAGPAAGRVQGTYRIWLFKTTVPGQ